MTIQKLLGNPNGKSAPYNEGLKFRGISRRTFIKSGTILSAATALPFLVTASNSAKAKPLMENDPISNEAFRGMMPIMATPVDNNFNVDMVSQRRHVDYCIQCGAVAVGHFAHASEFY